MQARVRDNGGTDPDLHLARAIVSSQIPCPEAQRAGLLPEAEESNVDGGKDDLREQRGDPDAMLGARADGTRARRAAIHAAAKTSGTCQREFRM
jgi:hypothetical protein